MAAPHPAHRKTSPPASQPFCFTSHMRRLCVDVTTRVPELAHVDMSRVAVGFSQARADVRHGLQATLTPMRFEGGQLASRRRGRLWTFQRLFDPSGVEMLYILNFYLPRFLNQPFGEKLTTVLHELWHIGPRFDGDLRRHGGRCTVHGPSQRRYDEAMRRLAAAYLATQPPAEAYDFLRSNFRQLVDRHGVVIGQRYPAPKLIAAEPDA